ncbi:MAG: hypothetical protein BMS9Abin29_0282 [Gemmatimonadota bacterium]|nr:MAG: hypothetical protein BMS9Abin29_0282 [Gemmatimonadota bacterium]
MKLFDQRGFTLVEVLTVMLILSIVTRIAIPQMQEVRVRARAAQALGDFRVIELAAQEYLADNNQPPPDADTGVVPPGLETYLEGFTFEKPAYKLDWENWVLPGGLPKHPETRVLLGVSISIDDPLLGEAIVGLVGINRVHYTLGNKYTFILEAL